MNHCVSAKNKVPMKYYRKYSTRFVNCNYIAQNIPQINDLSKGNNNI